MVLWIEKVCHVYVCVCLRQKESAPHHGSWARVRSFYTIILSSKILLKTTTTKKTKQRLISRYKKF